MSSPSIPFCLALAASLCALPLVPAVAADDDDDDGGSGLPNVLVEGVPLAGSANGVFFDEQDRLLVASVLGQRIRVLDPDTGDITDELGPEVGVVFPDDLTFTPDGTLYWTDPVLGLVQGLTPAGNPLTVSVGLPNSNPITAAPDGRLFFAQCYGTESNAIFEANFMNPLAPRVILQDGPGCASNGMDFLDGELFTPRWFENRITRVDVETGAWQQVAELFVPAAVKLDSRNRLHAVSQGNGEVVRIDRATGDVEVLATLEVGLDNLAFDSQDRLFVSSVADAFVVEVKRDGRVRTVSPGGLNSPGSLAVRDEVVTVGELVTLRRFDADDGDELGVVRSVFGKGPIPVIPQAITFLDDERLVLSSWFDGELAIWNAETLETELEVPYPGPVDTERFRGALAVSALGTGSVELISAEDFSPIATLATGLAVPSGLAANGSRDLYVSDSLPAPFGRVLQIVRDGVVLATPEPVTTEPFDIPEGLALRSPTELLVAEGGTNSLKSIDLRTGQVTVLAEDLAFLPSLGLPGFPPFWFLNHVEVDEEGAAYVNGDEDALVYKFEGPDADDDDDDDD